MSNSVAESHLRELGESAVADNDRWIASIPPELHAPFNIAAMRLEDELIRIYKQVVFCVRDESDLQKVASWWEFMVGMCDLFAERVSRLKAAHPGCGAESYYDRILDLRNKCQRLQEMHL
jgi:hypothetical protein